MDVNIECILFCNTLVMSPINQCESPLCMQETQTRPEGQIHFFPIIFDGKQLYDVMVERCGPTKGSGPKV